MLKWENNELMCPQSEARFVINPTNSSDDYEINIFDESDESTEPILTSTLNSICFK